METRKGLSPAFPIFLQEGLSHNSHVDCGMSTRLYLAGMAMTGMLANSELIRECTMDSIIKSSISWADELIKQEEESR